MIVRSMRFLLTVFMQSRLLRGMFHAEDIFLWSAAVPPSRELSSDGHKALEQAAQRSAVPDLIIADYNLPNGLNGLETIARLQGQAQHAIPAIICSLSSPIRSCG